MGDEGNERESLREVGILVDPHMVGQENHHNVAAVGLGEDSLGAGNLAVEVDSLRRNIGCS